jgi:hypothetical protein
VSGYGWSVVSQDRAKTLIGNGRRTVHGQAADREASFAPIEVPLLDWLGRATKRPVYSLVNPQAKAPFSVPCYDTSLYFDDLHLPDERRRGRSWRRRPAEGAAKGHGVQDQDRPRRDAHAAGSKVMTRDIAIVDAVRKQVGPDATAMVDANNALQREPQQSSSRRHRASKLYFLEERFTRTASCIATSRTGWPSAGCRRSSPTAKGDASPRLLDWAKRGWVDVLQYDIFHPGFSFWLELEPRLHAQGIARARRTTTARCWATTSPAPASAGSTWLSSRSSTRRRRTGSTRRSTA